MAKAGKRFPAPARSVLWFTSLHGKQLESSKTVWGEARELFAAAIIYDADGAYCLFGFGDAFGLGCVLVLATADRN